MSNIFTKPYKISFINGLILVLAGFTAYLLNPEKPVTALIGPFFGVIFITLTPLIRKKNKWVTYLIAFITFILLVMIIQILLKEPMAIDRRTIILSIMSISCLISFISFVVFFTKRQ